MKENAERLFDILMKRAVYGLTDTEQAELDKLEKGAGGDSSFDRTVAAISLIDAKTDEPMPMHLGANILAASERFFDEKENTGQAESSVIRPVVSADPLRGSFWNWLGWAAAAVACFALVVNIWLTRFQPGPEYGKGPTPTPTVGETLTLAQQRQKLIDSSGDLTKAVWSKGNDKEIASVSGDVVWSDTKQAGYMRLSGLPKNDTTKETYQLWVFEENQGDKTPIDGGTFDINSDGEVIIPINAKLKAKNPKMFAVTVEKPGGVVVSTREKIAAIGKLET